MWQTVIGFLNKILKQLLVGKYGVS